MWQVLAHACRPALPVFPRVYGEFSVLRIRCGTGSSPVTHPKFSPGILRNFGAFSLCACTYAYNPVNLEVSTTHKESPAPASDRPGQSPTSKEST